MSTSPISTLPEEILLSVFEYLDTSPPSILKSRHEPKLRLTSSKTQDYKSISSVSHRWRRIALPLLFRFARLRLDIEPRPAWKDCPVCGNGAPTSATSVSPLSYHEDLFENARNGALSAHSADDDAKTREESLCWASRIHHSVDDFLHLIRESSLASSVQSLVVYTDRMDIGMRDRFPHRLAKEHDHRYQAAAAMWQLILAELQPPRLVVLAPPNDMAWLCNCAIDVHGDWAFTDMAFHSLELGTPGASRSSRTLHQPTDPNALKCIPDAYPAIADSSILYLMPWTHIGLNEGSFLKAYGTYEYFERGPPSLVASIQDCLRRALIEPSKPAGLPAVRSFTYTAIFPFAQHLDVRAFLPQIEELDVQLAPDPASGILNDKDRVGKADLQDCWQEFFTAYKFITRRFHTFAIGPDWNPKLKRFVCRDRIPMALEDLDDIFTPLCLPVWVECERGVFTRQTDMPANLYFE